MLKRILALLLALVLSAGLLTATAEFSFFENEIPDEPIETDSEWLHVVAAYDVATDQTRYTAQLKDGSGLTAQDVLFSLYYYLDPGCIQPSALSEMAIVGLNSYRTQIAQERYDAALIAMEDIRMAGRGHAWSEGDSWTQEQQSAYWALVDEHAAATEAEFPVCAQRIVDSCNVNWLALDGWTVEQLQADAGLQIANAMVQWGYAAYEEDGSIIAIHSETVWNLKDGYAPSLNDFVAELKLAYDGDLAACWAIEAADDYEPQLPDIPQHFVLAFCADTTDVVPSISGIRMVDEQTVEIDVAGIDMRSEYELFGLPMLKLSDYGDAAQWSPETGLYGHPFGDVSAIDAALSADGGSKTVKLLDEPENAFFG